MARHIIYRYIISYNILWCLPTYTLPIVAIILRLFVFASTMVREVGCRYLLSSCEYALLCDFLFCVSYKFSMIIIIEL